MRVVSFMNYKGGVGKTTIAANIGAGLAARGHKVLMIDFDPQANLTESFFPYVDEDSWPKQEQTIKHWFDRVTGDPSKVPSLAKLVLKPDKVNDLVKEAGGCVGLLASHLGLLDIDMELAAWLFAGDDGQAAKTKRVKLHRFLADALEDDGLSEYDDVLIDCAPDFGIVTRIAMVASEYVVVPAKPEPLSTTGISYLVRSLKRLVHEYNGLSPAIKHIKPEFLGIVFNMIQMYAGQPTSTQRETLALTARNVDIEIFKTMLRNASRTAILASRAGVPAVLGDVVDGEFVGELNALTDEFLRRVERH